MKLLLGSFFFSPTRRTNHGVHVPLNAPRAFCLRKQRLCLPKRLRRSSFSLFSTLSRHEAPSPSRHTLLLSLVFLLSFVVTLPLYAPASRTRGHAAGFLPFDCIFLYAVGESVAAPSCQARTHTHTHTPATTRTKRKHAHTENAAEVAPSTRAQAGASTASDEAAAAREPRCASPHHPAAPSAVR